MFELKLLSKEAIPRAIEKADRYRLLNEPSDAESICLDVLAADPDNQRALVVLILAVSDQFGQEGFHVQQHQPRELLARIRDPYERAYYTGVVHERQAKSTRRRHVQDSMAVESFHKALKSYEEAMAIRPAGNEDAILRWNTCARIMTHHRDLQEVEQERGEAYGD
ncbi:MAG TPA: hypothetical protein VHL58_05820 [Thermoanaerobaculia bacterium]|nr:hypothetical protein [Thermoanaerobaculia bacterium]